MGELILNPLGLLGILNEMVRDDQLPVIKEDLALIRSGLAIKKYASAETGTTQETIVGEVRELNRHA